MQRLNWHNSRRAGVGVLVACQAIRRICSRQPDTRPVLYQITLPDNKNAPLNQLGQWGIERTRSALDVTPDDQRAAHPPHRTSRQR